VGLGAQGQLLPVNKAHFTSLQILFRTGGLPLGATRRYSLLFNDTLLPSFNNTSGPVDSSILETFCFFVT
jgi:hypothetical protein